MTRRRVLAFALALALFCAALFAGGAPVASANEPLAFTSVPMVMKVGDTWNLKANKDNVTFRSSNVSVLSVSAAGKVKAKKPGHAKVIVIRGGNRVTAPVTVRKRYVVGIDPGHQATSDLSRESIGPGSTQTKEKMTFGTSGVSTRKPEHQLNLEISLALEKELAKRGYKVVMSRRSPDVNLSNIDRALELNKSCDVVLRIHADGTNGKARGASALYPSPSNPYIGRLSAESQRLSRDVLDCYCAVTGLTNRGLVPRDDLTGTNWSVVPVTLIEMGFMTDAIEDEFMSMELGQKKMVKGLADGIDLYFNEGGE